jgi:glyoxylase-like metal-dependent hydrolase (beta-lactamase superfamily II)
MSAILEAAEAAWDGGARRHPWRALNVIEEVAPRTWFASSFANMVAFDTDEGYVIVDPGARNNAQQKFEWVRALPGGDAKTAHTIIYSHGHHDHIWGANLYQDDAKARSLPRPYRRPPCSRTRRRTRSVAPPPRSH